eukprot:PITA_04006
MSFNGLRLEYALEGSTNYIAWKDRMEVVLDDNGLKEFIDADVPKPTNAAQVGDWQKKTAKCRRILLEGVRDHIVSNLHGKASPLLMWKALTDLYQSKSDQRKLALKDKLKNIKFEKGGSMPKYLTKFTQCRDELGSVGVTIDDEDLVSLALPSLPKSWHSYQDSVNGREKLPGWERLWSDLVQEEIRRNTRDRSSSKETDEENCALDAKEKKGKNKKASHSGAKGKKQDTSKWCVFSHDRRSRFFSNLDEKDLGVHIEMGDDGRYSETNIDTISFKRESGKRFVLKEVMHVPGLKKNLISVAMLEDKGYDVVFSEEKAFLHSKTTRENRKIGKKSETYSKFCEFKELVEKESGKKVKALRSDNGGEYISGEFKEFCNAEGIRRELIAPHNPQ